MNVECLVLGELGVNCYLITEGKEAIVIDPGDEAQRIISAIEKRGCSLRKILLTHGHFDHIGAVSDLAEKTGADVYIHSRDNKMLTDNDCNLSFLTGRGIKTYDKAKDIDDLKEITLGESVIKLYHTPGHSEGSVSYLCEGKLFCGDLIFKGSIGRYDFGDLYTELNSIRFLMDNLPDETVIYPGHGPSTTIGREKVFNPYMMS